MVTCRNVFLNKGTFVGILLLDFLVKNREKMGLPRKTLTSAKTLYYIVDFIEEVRYNSVHNVTCNRVNHVQGHSIMNCTIHIYRPLP